MSLAGSQRDRPNIVMLAADTVPRSPKIMPKERNCIKKTRKAIYIYIYIRRRSRRRTCRKRIYIYIYIYGGDLGGGLPHQTFRGIEAYIYIYGYIRSQIRPAAQIVLGGEPAEMLDGQIGRRSGQGRF